MLDAPYAGQVEYTVPDYLTLQATLVDAGVASTAALAKEKLVAADGTVYPCIAFEVEAGSRKAKSVAYRVSKEAPPSSFPTFAPSASPSLPPTSAPSTRPTSRPTAGPTPRSVVPPWCRRCPLCRNPPPPPRQADQRAYSTSFSDADTRPDLQAHKHAVP